MIKKKEFALPLILLLLVGMASLYITVKYLGDFLYYNNLTKNGVFTTSVISGKEIIDVKESAATGSSSASNSHILKLSYTTPDNKNQPCKAVVSKNVYERSSINNSIEVVYLEDDNKRCYLTENAQGLYILNLLAVCFGAVFLLIFLLLALYIYKSFKKRDYPVKLSTEFSVSKDKIVCPECGCEMSEGYIPGVGGINWRERQEPVGLPNMLTGLPGTIFWFKRPILHAFNCKKCSVVTFMYGKK